MIHRRSIRPFGSLDPSSIPVLSVGRRSRGSHVVGVVAEEEQNGGSVKLGALEDAQMEAKNELSMRSSALPRRSDGLLLEDLDSTSPFEDREPLDGTPSSKNSPLLLGRLQGEFLSITNVDVSSLLNFFRTRRCT